MYIQHTYIYTHTLKGACRFNRILIFFLSFRLDKQLQKIGGCPRTIGSLSESCRSNCCWLRRMTSGCRTSTLQCAHLHSKPEMSISAILTPSVVFTHWQLLDISYGKCYGYGQLWISYGYMPHEECLVCCLLYTSRCV